MMTTEKLPWLPHAIYYDANALIRIPHTLQDPSFEAVVGFAKEYRIELFLPDVVWFEWLHRLFEKLQHRLTEIEKHAKHVESILGRPILDYERPDRDKVLAELTEKQMDRIRAAGFQMAETPNLEIAELLAQAITKQPPFQSGGKGFRDAVIVETAARHAAGKYDHPRILVISNDNAVQESTSRFKDRGVDVVICSAEKALDVLRASLSEAVTKTYELAKEAAIEFLSKHQDSVFKFITASEISLSSLESGMKEVCPFGFPTIRRLDAVRPIKVASALPGFPPLGVELPPNRYPLPFNVEVEFDLTIDYLMVGSTDRRSIPLGRPVAVEELPSSSRPNRKLEPESVTLVCDIRVEATVSTEGARDRSYKDLQMTKVWLSEVKNRDALGSA